MGEARPNYKSDVEARLKERVTRLEARDRERAAELARTQAFLRAAEKAMLEERRLRVEADRNAARFHAMLLRERVGRIVKKENR